MSIMNAVMHVLHHCRPKGLVNQKKSPDNDALTSNAQESHTLAEGTEPMCKSNEKLNDAIPPVTASVLPCLTPSPGEQLLADCQQPCHLAVATLPITAPALHFGLHPCSLQHRCLLMLPETRKLVLPCAPTWVGMTQQRASADATLEWAWESCAPATKLHPAP